jgi:hypothetical protein
MQGSFATQRPLVRDDKGLGFVLKTESKTAARILEWRHRRQSFSEKCHELLAVLLDS